MGFPRIGLRSKLEKVLLLVGVGAFVLFLFHFFHYDDSHVQRLVNSVSTPKQTTPGVIDANYILFPGRYSLNETGLREHLANTSSKDWKIVKVRQKDTKLVETFVKDPYVAHQDFSLYSSSALEQNQCDAKFNVTVDSLKVSKRTPIPADFRYILEHVVREHDIYKDPYYKDIAPLIMDHIREELKQDFIHPFWFRLAGSSVWLKDHNVHLVISRFVFSDKLKKNDPQVSLTLGQIFDENWNELRDVRLVFPTNAIDDETAPIFKSGSQSFSLYLFPRILPIPFYHDYGKDNGKLFGPEDPRLMLVKNPDGYEEPLIVFNAQHYRFDKKKSKREENGEGTSLDAREEMEKVRYRSMFFTLPFQLQRSKRVDLEENKRADHKWFAKTKEIHVENMKKDTTNKNWTPMVSSTSSLTFNDYDDNILFVTQLDNLKVVRCSIYTDDTSCHQMYNSNGDVGMLRGGTPFININTLIAQQHPEMLNELFPTGREVFIGISRANLKSCGCSTNFYRPNIVVITKDQASYYDHKTGEDKTKFFYKVSHVSSSLSLEVEMDPWLPEDPKSVCGNTNALIPNGIGSWNIDSLKKVGDRWEIDDSMSLALSVADNSVDRVYLLGVLNAVVNSYDNSVLYSPNGFRDGQSMSLPILTKDGELEKPLLGFNNDNINCAMRTSKDFCANYGAMQKAIIENLPDADTKKSKEKFDKEFEEFEKALEKSKSKSNSAKDNKGDLQLH